MKPGVGWILAGVGLLGAAIAFTIWSDQLVWYGGMIVGVIWIVRGIVRLAKGRARPSEPPANQRE